MLSQIVEMRAVATESYAIAFYAVSPVSFVLPFSVLAAPTRFSHISTRFSVAISPLLAPSFVRTPFKFKGSDAYGAFWLAASRRTTGLQNIEGALPARAIDEKSR